jgi:hypothetical protein
MLIKSCPILRVYMFRTSVCLTDWALYRGASYLCDFRVHLLHITLLALITFWWVPDFWKDFFFAPTQYCPEFCGIDPNCLGCDIILSDLCFFFVFGKFLYLFGRFLFCCLKYVISIFSYQKYLIDFYPFRVIFSSLARNRQMKMANYIVVETFDFWGLVLFMSHFLLPFRRWWPPLCGTVRRVLCTVVL